MRYVATIGARQISVDIEDNGHVREVVVDGVAGRADWHLVGGATHGAGEARHYSLLLGTHSFDVAVARTTPVVAGEAPRYVVMLAGQTYDVRLEDERLHALAGMAGTSHEHGEASVTAPMPGLVSQVVAAVGQRVERGQTVVVLEAMKMENDLGAPRTGVVRQLTVTKGDTVNQGQVLAVIGDEAGASPVPEDE